MHLPASHAAKIPPRTGSANTATALAPPALAAAVPNPAVMQTAVPALPAMPAIIDPDICAADIPKRLNSCRVVSVPWRKNSVIS